MEAPGRTGWKPPGALASLKTISHPAHMRAFLLAAAAVCALAAAAEAQITPHEAVAAMGRGINLGNTLEPPTEGAWNNPAAQERYFDRYVEAGFQTVRVPVRWDQHTGNAPPYAVDEAWMDRVEQVVDWGLERDLFVILNAHHEDWLKQNYADPAVRARFDSIWVQVAERFQGKSDKLLMEIINEPFGMSVAEVDDLNARVLGLIRETNPTRLVIFSGNRYSNIPELLNAAIPDPDDPYLVGYFHSYDPWSFAGMAQGTWGSASDRLVVRQRFAQVVAWSERTGIPVVISEFGAIRGGDDLSRRVFYQTYVEEALRAGFAFQVWDDGGDFRVLNRDDDTWRHELSPLIHAYPDGPTDLRVLDDGPVELGWTLRSDPRSGETPTVHVQRRGLGSDAFVEIADLDPGATAFTDEASIGGQTYRYRVVERFADGTDKISYPVEVRVALTARSPFGGAPTALPGTVEAEDFDTGGEGLTYHDTTPDNGPGAYRQDVAVDIAPRAAGGFWVTDIANGEWLEYTVSVAEAGTYDLTAHIASTSTRGRFRVSVGEQRGALARLVDTGSLDTTAPIVTTLTLPAGEQVLRLDLLTGEGHRVDRIEVARSTATSSEAAPEPGAFRLYPNPAAEAVTLELAAPAAEGHAAVFNVLGQEVRRVALAPGATHTLRLDGLAAGTYLVRAVAGDQVLGQRVLVKR